MQRLESIDNAGAKISPKEELFAMKRQGGQYYLYAPLRKALALVNSACLEVVGRYLEKGSRSLSSEEHALMAELEKQGMFGGRRPEPPIFPEGYIFCPHEVTLFLTSRCNLACRYCYADAGRKDKEMAWETARAAIDFVAGNAGRLGNRSFAVGFHGGGEPTQAWQLLARCVKYTLAKGEETGLTPELFAATNGLLSPEQRTFIVDHFTTANISLDGPPDIQDHNRPTARGGPSSSTIDETLRYFEKCNFRYGIRATITAETVSRLEEIVNFLTDAYAPDYLHLEPVWRCGRCISSGEKPPAHADFIRHFVAASRIGDEKNVQVTYSGARLNVLACKFCAAPGDGFSVLPEGMATSCFEIVEPDDPKAELFHYGRYDRQKQAFVFDEERLMRLSSFSVDKISHCSDCFCKWHCAGDCLSKVFEESGSFVHNGSSRCELNRALTLQALESLLPQQEQLHPAPGCGEDHVGQTE